MTSSGNGRTAAKFSVNRFTRRYVAGFAGRYHPISNFADESRSWFDCVLHPRVHDPGATVSRADCATAAELTAAGLSAAYLNTNGDDIAQDHEVGLVRNTAVFNDAGGVPIAGRRPDPDIEREWNLEWTASVQHEIAPRISVTAAYYRRNFYDIPGSRNLALNECAAPQLATPGVPCGDWTPFNVTFDDPLGRVPHLAGQSILVFNQDPATRGVAPDRVDQNLDAMTLTYNAVELSFNARLPNGGTLFGGWTGAQHVENTCGALDNPNGQNVAPMISGEGSQIMGGRFCDKSAIGIPFRHDFKMWGVYPLPYDVHDQRWDPALLGQRAADHVVGSGRLVPERAADVAHQGVPERPGYRIYRVLAAGRPSDPKGVSGLAATRTPGRSSFTTC